MGEEEEDPAKAQNEGGKDLAKIVGKSEGKRGKESTEKVRGKLQMILSESPLSMYGQMPLKVKMYGATRLSVLPTLHATGGGSTLTRGADGIAAAASHKDDRKEGGDHHSTLSATAPGQHGDSAAAVSTTLGRHSDHKRRVSKKKAGSPIRMSTVKRFCEVSDAPPYLRTAI